MYSCNKCQIIHNDTIHNSHEQETCEASKQSTPSVHGAI